MTTSPGFLQKVFAKTWLHTETAHLSLLSSDNWGPCTGISRVTCIQPPKQALKNSPWWDPAFLASAVPILWQWPHPIPVRGSSKKHEKTH